MSGLLRRLPLVVLAGLVGALLYAHGVPSWAVYVVRHLVYELGGAAR